MMKLYVKDYLPLIYVYLLTSFITFGLFYQFSFNFKQIVFSFLGIFSLIFGLLKIFRINDFVEAFSEYDFVTQKFRIYGYLFPVLEITFGISFLFQVDLLIIEILCLSLFIINSVSVTLALKKNQKFICACLGDLIKVPLSKISLFENLTMIIGIIILLLI